MQFFLSSSALELAFARRVLHGNFSVPVVLRRALAAISEMFLDDLCLQFSFSHYAYAQTPTVNMVLGWGKEIYESNYHENYIWHVRGTLELIINKFSCLINYQRLGEIRWKGAKRRLHPMMIHSYDDVLGSWVAELITGAFPTTRGPPESGFLIFVRLEWGTFVVNTSNTKRAKCSSVMKVWGFIEYLSDRHPRASPPLKQISQTLYGKCITNPSADIKN